MQKTVNDICDEIEKATRCHEGYKLALAVIGVIIFTGWLRLYA